MLSHWRLRVELLEDREARSVEISEGACLAGEHLLSAILRDGKASQDGLQSRRASIWVPGDGPKVEHVNHARELEQLEERRRGAPGEFWLPVLP